MMKVLALVLLVVCVVSGKHLHFTFCADGVPMPTVGEANVIDVWYLEAPVFEGEFGNLFAYLHGFHSAFGFRDKTTGMNYTVEYDAISEVLNATLPFVNVNETTGQPYIKWFDGGGICIENHINDTYYDHKKTHMGTINGTQLNAFFKWLPSDNTTWDTYQLWDMYDHWEGPDATPWVHSSTCVDFNWRGFQKLYELGMKFNYNTRPERDFINLYGPKPFLIDEHDAFWHPKLIKFYQDWHLAMAKNKTEFLEWLETALIGDKFLHAYGQYWYMPKLVHPYMEMIYVYDPLPGTPNATIAKHMAAAPPQRVNLVDMVKTMLGSVVDDGSWPLKKRK